MAAENNPLRQYFRKPAIYIKLPSGGRQYKPGIVDLPENGELPVYSMTALDEITVRTPDALFNGQAVVDLIKSCVPNIKEPWKINSIDLDALLIGIRTATDGNKHEISTVCPACKEAAIYDINLVGCLNDLNPRSYEQEYMIGPLTFKFKPLSYKDLNEVNLKQFEIQRLFETAQSLTETDQIARTKQAHIMISEMAMNAISKSIEYVKTDTIYVDQSEYILDFIKNAEKALYEEVKGKTIELKQSAQIKPLKMKCMHCGHDYEQEFTLNISDFFE